MRTYAIFDFCETLIPYQTGDLFLKYIISKLAPKWKQVAILILLNRVSAKLLFLIFSDKMIKQKILFYFLKDTPVSALDSVIDDFVAKIQIDLDPRMMEVVNQKILEGERVVIVSGSYELFLKKLFAQHQVHLVVGSKLEIKTTRFSGNLVGAVCLGREKVRRIAHLTSDIDRINSSVYSDCVSDKPLFELVESKRYLVELQPNNKPVLSQYKM